MYRLRKSNRFLQRYDDLNLIETYYYLLFACLDYYLSLSLLATYLVYCGLYIVVSCTKWKMLKIESLLCTLTSLNARVCSNVVMKWISGAKHTTRALSSPGISLLFSANRFNLRSLSYVKTLCIATMIIVSLIAKDK